MSSLVKGLGVRFSGINQSCNTFIISALQGHLEPSFESPRPHAMVHTIAPDKGRVNEQKVRIALGRISAQNHQIRQKSGGKPAGFAPETAVHRGRSSVPVKRFDQRQ